jgi:HAD superfamily phosphatase (TIGR01668 family)
MKESLIPYAVAESVYDIDPSFYARQGAKAVICDLDNTLDPYYVKTPSQRAIDLAKRFKEAGVRLYVGSNNNGKRVHTYCSVLGVGHAFGLLKPFAFRMRRWLKKNGLKPDEVIMVGDQVYTDVLCASRAHIRCILTKPLSERDPIWTRHNRKKEARVRAEIEEKGLARKVGDL